MGPLIEKIRAIRENLLKSIWKAYGRHAKLKVKLVIATRNITWSGVDIDKCQQAQLGVLADGELDYYSALTARGKIWISRVYVLFERWR